MTELWEFLAGLTRLDTARLTLRPLQLTDATAMYQWLGNPDNTKFLFPAMKDVQATRAYLVKSYLKAPLGKWGIELTSSGALIGTIALNKISPDVRLGQLSYCLVKSEWHKGLMTEALDGLCQALLTPDGLKKLVLQCDVENLASKKVAQHCYFQRVKREKARNPNGSDMRIFETYEQTRRHFSLH